MRRFPLGFRQMANDKLMTNGGVVTRLQNYLYCMFFIKTHFIDAVLSDLRTNPQLYPLPSQLPTLNFPCQGAGKDYIESVRLSP